MNTLKCGLSRVRVILLLKNTIRSNLAVYRGIRSSLVFTTAPLILQRTLKHINLKSIVISAPLLILLTYNHKVEAIELSMEDTIKKIDELYFQNKFEEAYDLFLPHKDTETELVQWKFARVCYRLGKKTGSRQYADMAMAHIDKAVKIDPDSFHAQKWRGIILSWYCDFEGYKKKIERSYEIKENFDKACKLDPNDPTAKHLLGRWFYNVADVPWYMKSAAKYILAELPSATYENALETFLEAEKIQEGFFSQNWLYIGKCHYNLKHKEEAKVWLKKASEVVGDDQDTVEARKEASELLKKL